VDYTTGLAAAFWGFVAGSALLIGALIGLFIDVPRRLVAAIMAFGAGVLFSALSFDLVEEAFARAGFISTALGFVAGALIYTTANVVISGRGARHRKRAGNEQAVERSATGDNGLAIAFGSLLDGIPESIGIGLTMIEGGIVSVATVVAIFLSNVPEGLSSAAGMRRAGRGPGFVLGVWAAAVAVFAAASSAGYLLFEGLPDEVTAGTTALAAGGILAMLVDTMVPEAFEGAHEFTGLIMVLGFLTAFLLSKGGG
jgi:ZIP family zinc transporter